MATINCGMGNQPVRWLGDVAVHKYDRNMNMDAGTPIGLRFPNGVETKFAGNNNTVADEMQDDVHLYMIFAEDNLEEKNAMGSGRGKKKQDKK